MPSSVFATLFAAAVLALAAPAQANPSCPALIRYEATPLVEPPVNNTRSARELSETGHARHVTLGRLEVSARMNAQGPSNPCEGPLVVRMEYREPVLHIAKELMPGSCGFNHVLRHEREHVRLYQDISEKFSQVRLETAEPVTPMEAALAARARFQELLSVHKDLDTPEEYARNLTACGGEIARAVGLRSY